MSSERIEDRTRRFPNQGVRRSLSNSILLALISSGIICIIGTLSFVPRYGLSEGLLSRLGDALILAICGGLLVCASRGGLAVLRRYVIRFLLARSHTFPWHAPRFLEEATARILLRRVGGGYSFPHRLLLEYFADLDQEPPPSPPG